MHHGLGRREERRRGAPRAPKPRRRPSDQTARPASGFESLIPVAGDDLFFSGWIDEPDRAAEILEHGADREPLSGEPNVGLTTSAVFHVLLVLFLLVEPNFDFLGRNVQQPAETDEAEREPLVMFFEPEPPPEVAAVPVVPVQPVPQAEPAPAPDEPPQVADNRILIPKAMLAPPEDKVQEFMNDLPFSEGNTDEFYTSEEVKDPGAEGETETPPEAETRVARDSGEDETFQESAEGVDAGNGGTEADAKPSIDAKNLGDFLFGQPNIREEMRPRADIKPPDPRRVPDRLGEGGEDGRFTDIRRFLADAQFHNPEGGLVSNTNNTLYYNDKGANFVPWIARLIAEVKRNWLIPQNAAWDHGHIAVRISVDRSGSLLAMETLVPSGVSSFDVAATGAIRGSRLLPLPADYPDERFEIILVFWYNERPYDLFG